MERKLDKNAANYIKARGKIISIGRDNFGHDSIVLLITRATVNRPLKLSFALSKGLPLDVELRDYVNITGHVKAYKESNNEGGENYIQYLIADTVEKDVPELQKLYDTDQGFAHEDSNIRVCLAGELIEKNHNKDAGWINIMVKVPSFDDQRDFYTVAAQYSEKMRVNDVDNKVGDKIALVAFMSSKTKIRNNIPIYFENFIVDDMFVVEDGSDDNKHLHDAVDKKEEEEKQEESSDIFELVNI